MTESIIGKQTDDKSRVVDVWVRSKRTPNSSGRWHGNYNRDAEQSDVEFSAFLLATGFTIIPVTVEEQLEYGCNVLNLGSGRIISTERNSARRIVTHAGFSGTVEFLDFSAVTAMYGGVHCCSQVVRRVPS